MVANNLGPEVERIECTSHREKRRNKKGEINLGGMHNYVRKFTKQIRALIMSHQIMMKARTKEKGKKVRK